MRERNQLDVYGTWAVLRNQLNTDDSFQFNKAGPWLPGLARPGRACRCLPRYNLGPGLPCPDWTGLGLP